MFRSALAPIAILACAAALPAAAQTMTSKQYVMKAGASDQYEIQSSKLLLTSTSNPQLKQFAQQMISDHTDSTNKVKMAAKSAGMTVASPHLDAMGRSNIAKLRAAHGQARDAMYVDQQKTSHQMALQVQQDEANNGTSQPLKDAAAQIVPVVQSHIDMLNSMPSMSSGM